MSQVSAESSAVNLFSDSFAPLEARSKPNDNTSVKRQILITFLSVLCLVVIAYVDVIIGPQVHFGLLYVVPVLIAGWFAGRWPGYVLTVVASVGWLYAGRPPTDGPGLLVNGTNVLIRGSFYVVIVELLVALRDFGRRLESAVQQRTSELQLEVARRERAQAALRTLACQLSAAEDVERKRIAYDIHDGLSQMLGVVKMNLETVVAETAIDTRQFERLNDLVKVLNDLIQQTRAMTFDLHPSMLDHFGLVPTLQRFAEDFKRRTMAEVTINESGERLALDSGLASYLFRAVKELVNNAVKHGNASEIIVAIHWERVLGERVLGESVQGESGQGESGQAQARIRCVVDDDGCGFDPPTALAPQARRGLGLAGMDERLTSLGGKLRVESQPGKGARLIVEVPVIASTDLQ